MTAFQPARLRALLFAFLAVTLAGCATNQAFEDGKKALISGEQERALSLFEQATKEAPDNPEFRATFFRQREVAVSKLLAQAENARLAGRRDEATAALDKAQTLDPRNQRAQFIRDQMTRGVRHDAMVREARTLLERKDMGGAEARLRRIDPASGEYRAPPAHAMAGKPVRVRIIATDPGTSKQAISMASVAPATLTVNPLIRVCYFDDTLTLTAGAQTGDLDWSVVDDGEEGRGSVVAEGDGRRCTWGGPHSNFD